MHTLPDMISNETRIILHAHELEGIIVEYSRTRLLDIIELSRVLTIINQRITTDMKRRENAANGQHPF